MRILIVSQEFPPTVGGAGVVAYQNAIALTRAGHNVSVLTVEPKGVEVPSYPFDYIAVPRCGRLWVILLSLRIARFELSNGDCLILNDVGAAMAFSMLPKSLRARCVHFAYLHGGEVDSLIRKVSRRFRVLGVPQRIMSVFSQSDTVISVSDYMKDYFLTNVEAFRRHRIRYHIETVYAGIDTELFRPTESSVREKYGLASTTTVLISVGRIIPQKGFPRMLDLYARLVAETDSQRFHWLIVGDGTYKPEMVETAASLGLQDHVTFVGPVLRSELPQYYSASDLFWLLSEREAEAFGLVYVEAQACGVPALGWNTYGVREAILPGVTGYLADSADDVLNILSNQTFRSLVPEKILQFAQTFDTKLQAKRLSTILSA